MITPAKQFLYRFINNANAYALQRPTGGYFACRDKSITADIFADHLLQIITLGVYSNDPVTNTCRWVCWDIDESEEAKLNILIEWLAKNNINSIRESVRYGRSGHLWIFFDEPLDSAQCYRLGQYAKFYADLDCEVFPKNQSLKSGQLGNLVRLPLGKHQKPSANGAIGLFYDCPDENVVTQLFWFLDQPLNDSKKVLSVIDTLPKPKTKKRPNRGKTSIKIPLVNEFPEDWPMKEQSNGEIIAKCPACELAGFDRQSNNLSINPEENVLFCHRNQGEHDFKTIMRALRQIKQNHI